MLQLLTWTALSLAAFMAATTAYVVLQAWLGLSLGVRVIRICVGCDLFGSYLLRWHGRHCEWILGILPLGGYTKFVGSGDEKDDRANAEEGADMPADLAPESSSAALPPGSYLAASPAAKIAIQLVGPLSQIALGITFLAIPVAMAAKQLELTSHNASVIRPCVVSGLAESDRSSSCEGQLHLFEDVGTNVFRKILLFRPLDGWGGYLGCMLTCGAAAVHSWSVWLTCIGIVVLTVGVANLLPIPIFNGGHIVTTLVETICGRRIPERLSEPFTWIGLILILIWLGRLIAADVLWLWALARQA
jgi:membrane-associated protease RseP (regulator of RpoE activity)